MRLVEGKLTGRPNEVRNLLPAVPPALDMTARGVTLGQMQIYIYNIKGDDKAAAGVPDTRYRAHITRPPPAFTHLPKPCRARGTARETPVIARDTSLTNPSCQ